MAIYVEAGAMCGGSICAWCLHAIPNPGTSRDVHRNCIYEITPDKIIHSITGSTKRCECVNFQGTPRSLFMWSQSKFFITEGQYKAFKVLENGIRQRNRDWIVAAIDSLNKQYFTYHMKIKSTPEGRDLFDRVLEHCIDMTTIGLKCSLCKMRRVDIEPYLALGDIDSPKYHAAKNNMQRENILSIQIARTRVLYDGPVMCADCTYGLLRPAVENDIPCTKMPMDILPRVYDWDMLTQELNDALVRDTST